MHEGERADDDNHSEHAQHSAKCLDAKEVAYRWGEGVYQGIDDERKEDVPIEDGGVVALRGVGALYKGSAETAVDNYLCHSYEDENHTHVAKVAGCEHMGKGEVDDKLQRHRANPIHRRPHHALRGAMPSRCGHSACRR